MSSDTTFRDMERRPFLALLATAVAGCNATDQSVPTDTPTATPTDTPTATPTDTSTATPTDTPTATPADTPTATAAERAGREAIAEVRKTLGAVLEQYRGDAGETILATDAAGTFQGRTVRAGVAEARDEIATARERAATATQERTVERLATLRQFLRAATEAQVELGNAYYHLQRTRDAFEAVDGRKADRAIESMDTSRRIVRAPYRTIVEETSAEATTALPGLEAAAYRAKREQFDAEMAAFGELRGPLEEFAGGVGRIESALALRRNGSTEKARRSAEAAVDQLERAETSLTAFADGLEPPADSLLGMGRELSDLAATTAAETREQFELSG
jgi:hypothetical protein